MIRNLKALGLALVAVFAMSAVAAVGAQAETNENKESIPAFFLADTTTANAIYEAEGEGPQVFNTDFGGFVCDEVTGNGTAANTSATATLQNVAYTGGFEETAECLALEAFGATVDFNTCDYLFKAVTSTGAGTAEGTADVQCATEGDKIEVIVAGGLCTVTVPAQEGLGPITYHNKVVEGLNNDQVTVDASVKNIKYEGHGLFCETGVRNNGTYEGNAIVKAFNDNEAKLQRDATIEP
jgi:hypothetical protein